MNKLIGILVIILFGSFGCGGGGSDNAAEWSKKIGEKMCAKMGECADEMMKSLPAAARAQAREHMITKEKCMENMNKEMAQDRERLGQVKLTSAEVKLAQNCLREITGMKCMAMARSQPGSCEKLGKLLDAKHK